MFKTNPEVKYCLSSENQALKVEACTLEEIKMSVFGSVLHCYQRINLTLPVLWVTRRDFTPRSTTIHTINTRRNFWSVDTFGLEIVPFYPWNRHSAEPKPPGAVDDYHMPLTPGKLSTRVLMIYLQVLMTGDNQSLNQKKIMSRGKFRENSGKFLGNFSQNFPQIFPEFPRGIFWVQGGADKARIGPHRW